MKDSVVIIGGGIAGMSAAHELIDRGFKVTVLEKHPALPGGKARSVLTDKIDPLKEDQKGLPGEHGFRFFPGFYRHIIDVMQRTPFVDPSTQQPNTNGVADNLIEAPKMMLTRQDKEPIRLPSGYPKSWSDVQLIIKAIFNTDTGLEEGEPRKILLKIWQLMTSSRARRLGEYEHIGWWDYCEADVHSEDYRKLFVDGLTRTLVAAKAKSANTFTNGNILLQMIFSMTKKHEVNDRILNGPTNETWLFPWLEYLKQKGVDYHFNTVVESLEEKSGSVSAVIASCNGETLRFESDYYLCALPVEQAAKVILGSTLPKFDPRLELLRTLQHHVAWMNGIQFFLKEDVKINEGHIIMADSPWAITAISQAQFWNHFDWSDHWDGSVNGVLSIDVSDWDAIGWKVQKMARNSTKGEVIDEVWHQIKININYQEEVLKDENVAGVYVDEAIIFDMGFLSNKKNESFEDPILNEPIKYGSNKSNQNEEPLLVNQVHSWSMRPEARTAIPNFFLASDYVRTETNLATMEAANEAARKAVNNLLETAKSNQKPCQLWAFEEPNWLLYYKWLDHRRYIKGLPWQVPKIKWYALPFSWLLRLIGNHKHL
ncbi:MAG: FAD-dependent oxidoreductase [Marinoscillum sp.]